MGWGFSCLLDPPPTKESKRNGDTPMDNGRLLGGIFDGEKELYDPADHRFITKLFEREPGGFVKQSG